jgi:predicted site-specific integrase-resolvase
MGTPQENTKKDACEYLGITYNILDIWIELGLPQIVIDATIRLDQVEIGKWMYAVSKHLNKFQALIHR